MADIFDEELVPFRDGRRLLPGKPNKLALRNWAKRGIMSHTTGKRIKLEFCYVGRTPHTSQEAYMRFMTAINRFPVMSL